MIVKKTFLKSLKIRNTLSKDLLYLTEKYLKSGDLWGFLSTIDDRIHRLKDTIETNQGIEDTLASTFIRQVLTKRQQDFDGAWDTFSRVVTSHGKPEGNIPPKDVLSAISTPKQVPKKNNNSSSLHKLKKSKITNNKIAPSATTTTTTTTTTSSINNLHPHPISSMETVLQGPYLRRAVTATVREAVTAELDNRKKSESRSVKLIEDLQDAYKINDNQHSSSSSSSSSLHRNRNRNHANTTTEQPKSHSSNASVQSSSQHTSTTTTTTTTTPLRSRKKRSKNSFMQSPTDKEIPPESGMKKLASISRDWVSQAVINTNNNNPNIMASVKIEPGEVDIFKSFFLNLSSIYHL